MNRRGSRKTTRNSIQLDKPSSRTLRWWIGIGLVCSVLVVCTYLVFFRIHQVGSRAVWVNSERVESVRGFSVYRTTWLSRADVQRFLSRMGVASSGLSHGSTKLYQGVPYVPSSNVVTILHHAHCPATFAENELRTTTIAGQHYQYVSHGDDVRQRALWIGGRAVGYLLTVTHREAVYVPADQVATVFDHGGLKATFHGTILDVNLTEKSSPIPINNPEDYVTIDFGSGKSLFAPSYDWHGQTYIPVDSVNASLSQLGYATKLGGWQWELTPAAEQSKSTVPTVLAFVPAYFGDLAAFTDVTQHSSIYTTLAADLWTVDSKGSLLGSAPAGTTGPVTASGDKAYAMISNLESSGANSKVMTEILSNRAARTNLQNAIVNLVTADDYDGATLDFESIVPTNRQRYSQFVQHLATRLHQVGKQLQVVIPPDTGSTSEPWNGAYDQAVLGAAADAVIVMAYDYSYPGGPAGPIAPLPWVSQTLAYTASRVPADKIVLGLDAYGYDWSKAQTIAVSLPNVDSFLKEHRIAPKWDSTAFAPWFTWNDSSGQKHTVYYENGKSTSLKLTLANNFGIQGAAVWRAGLEDSPVLGALKRYKELHP